MNGKRHTGEILIRRLHAADQEKIYGHFRRLDVDSRRARFLGFISDDRVSAYACNIFRKGGILCGAFVDGVLRGIFELRGAVLFWPSTTEVAFSVESDWQNIGIGDALFERMLAMARNRGVKAIHFICLCENSRMKHLAAKHDAQLALDQDVAQAVLFPSWPTLASLAIEIIGEAQCYAKEVLGKWPFLQL